MGGRKRERGRENKSKVRYLSLTQDASFGDALKVKYCFLKTIPMMKHTKSVYIVLVK